VSEPPVVPDNACCWIAEMPLSDSQVRALKAGERRQSNHLGDFLILVIESVARGVGKAGSRSAGSLMVWLF